MKNVIYKIRNIINNKFYVGSTVNSRVRFQTHRRNLRAGKHQSPHMQAAWNKYGEDCFKFEIIEIVECSENLLAAEQKWLDEHAGKPHCYNWAAPTPSRRGGGCGAGWKPVRTEDSWRGEMHLAKGQQILLRSSRRHWGFP